MEVSWLTVLLDNISSFLSLSSSIHNLDSNPAHKYYSRGEEISKLIKPVLENLASDSAPSELLNNGFEELARYVDELKDQFENWQPLSSRIFYVLRIESLASKLREWSLEVFQLLKHCEQHLPTDLISPSFEDSMELVKLVARDEIAYTIDLASINQKEGIGPTSEILMKIAECVGLRSNQEILIEGVVLSNSNENEINTEEEAEFIDGLISLVTKMHDYLFEIKQSELHYPVSLPSDFRCPLSLELMTDPVTVESGQTYERVFIEKWFDMGLMVCPKTRQALSHTTLTPNYIVKASITNWSEAQNVDSSPTGTESLEATKRDVLSRSASAPGIIVSKVVPKPEISIVAKAEQSITRSRIKRPTWRHFRHPGIVPATIRETGSSWSIETEVKKLIKDLKSPSFDTQREATARIRILSRNSTDNRIVIAKLGAINSLVALLYSKDDRIQVDAVTCLLNLSINDNNNSVIADSGSIKPLIHVLKTGSIEAKENAAATILSLSVVEKNKTKIGEAGAIEPLVELLGNGTSLRGKKDAATALLNLSMNNENKRKVIEAGAVRYLIELMDPRAGMVEKMVCVLANLAYVKEGRNAIYEEGGIPVMVEVMELGSTRGKENAAAGLFLLCTHSPRLCNVVIREGAIPPLMALIKSGSLRGKEKAQSLLKCIQTNKQNNQREKMNLGLLQRMF